MQSVRRLHQASRGKNYGVLERRYKAGRRYSAIAQRQLRLAVIGAGPAGYYSAYRIMKKLPDSHIDMYESLPSPYGLVRFGVAPDHPNVKTGSVTLDDVAKWPNFNYIGNVRIGNRPNCLPLTTLAQHYDAILFSYGASKDKKLDIPGESLKGVHSARDFVGWYNGLPECAHMQPDLESGDTAVVLGQGNVALDVTRILLSPLSDLKHTDITEQALEALSRSKIRNVQVVGRRGPLQAPATIKELRELMSIPAVQFKHPDEGWDKHMGISRKSLPRQLKRIMELLEKGSSGQSADVAKTWALRYLLSPQSFICSEDSDSLGRMRFEQTEYSPSLADAAETILAESVGLPEWERLPTIMNKMRAVKVRGTGATTDITASLAFRSIGYLSEPIDGLADIGIPFDERLGIIPNDINGRVMSPDRGPGGLTAGHVPGMYCAGWVKRGPTGVIASTLDDANRTADTLISDWENRAAFNAASDGQGLKGVQPVLDEHNIRSINWQDWERIDQEERRRGEAKGKPREKINDVQEMLRVLDS